MKTSTSRRGFQKIILLVLSVAFLMFSIWLYNNQQTINHYSHIATMQSFAQDNVKILQQDIEQLQLHIVEQDTPSIEGYIKANLNNHKKWLTNLILGADDSEQLAEFSNEYLSLLLMMRVDGETGISANSRKLLRLLEDVSQPKVNIELLAKQRAVSNLEQLNQSIRVSNIILLCLVVIFVVSTIFSYLRFSSQLKQTYKYQRLSLYFVDHPHILLRLSLHSRIKYFNKQAGLLLAQKKIDKYKLLPTNIADIVARAIKSPDKIICYQHNLEEHRLDCELRFCRTSQQIFIEIMETHASKKIKPTNALAENEAEA